MNDGPQNQDNPLKVDNPPKEDDHKKGMPKKDDLKNYDYPQKKIEGHQDVALSICCVMYVMCVKN